MNFGGFGAAMAKTGKAVGTGFKAAGRGIKTGFKKMREMDDEDGDDMGAPLNKKQKTINAISGGLQSLGGNEAPELPFKRPSSRMRTGESDRGTFGFGKKKRRPSYMEE